jgi:preprotein translocase subunit SecA
MDALKQGIGLRGYAQVDPKVEYKREGYDKFQLLTTAVAEEVTSLLFRLQVRQDDQARLEQRWTPARSVQQGAAGGGASGGGRASTAALAAMQRGRDRAASQNLGQGTPEPIVRRTDRVGRNDTCPCGSGKKYKRCCFPKFET